MSTTVNYKGSSIATVNNATKTLTTAGKWLEGDIQLVDVTEEGAASITDETNTTGTTAVITGEVPEYGTKTITENGTYAAEDDGLDGYSEVTVNIPSSGGYSIDDIANGGSSISGAITITGTYIRQYAFCNTNITSVDAPNLIDGGAGNYFRACTKLVSANLPKFAVTSPIKAAGVFAECSSLETVNAPLMRIGGSSFDGCVKLKKYVNIQTTQMNLGSYEFRNCSSLEALDLNKIGQFGTSPGWNNTSKLTTIVLRRSDAIVPLNNANNVPPTMKSDGIGCTVYVPSALVSTYETATNWSTLVAGGKLTFSAIEGSQYENYYADGTAIS